MHSGYPAFHIDHVHNSSKAASVLCWRNVTLMCLSRILFQILYYISSERVQIDLGKVKSILSWELLHYQRCIASLGFASVYYKFISDLSVSLTLSRIAGSACPEGYLFQ